MMPKLSLLAGLKKLVDHPLVKGYGLPVGCILISFVLLLIAVRPTFNKIMALRAEQAAARDSLSALTTKVEQLEGFASQSEALDGEFKRFDQAVPSESNVPTLLTQIQAIATLSGVDIAAMQFGGEARAAGTAAEGQKWAEVRLKLVVEGSFDNIVKLLQTLESATRVIDVESVQYNVQAGEGASTLAAELTLIAYYTSEPTLSAETPITFSFADEAFERNSQVLLRLTPYETSIP